MDSELIGGLYPKKRDGQPDFVIGKLSINVPQFREWMAEYLKANQGSEWVNIDMLVSKAGKGYAKLDTWEPDKKQEPESSEDIPF
jgi:hypothetical protein